MNWSFGLSMAIGALWMAWEKREVIAGFLDGLRTNREDLEVDWEALEKAEKEARG